MITLDQLIKETGVNRYTLAKYRDLGLIPKPTIVHRGYKKEGQPRGNEALYPSYTPWLIREIGRLKREGFTLRQIRDEIPQVENITPEEEVAEPLELGRLGEAARSIGHRLDQLARGYSRVLVEYETDEKDGKLRVEAVWGIEEKKAEGDNR